jgi:hypothetical protein
MEIPVYLITGFLDGGKTTFINGVLEEGFAAEDRTLLISCEEGEVEYDPKVLENVDVVQVEDEEELTTAYLKKLEKTYKPKQVIFEYNGMWQMNTFYNEVLPKNWVLYQLLAFVDANTFDIYAKNMGALMMEKIRNADMVVFNRCTDELKTSLRRRNLRLVNRRADMFLEDLKGNSENYADDSVAPFDLDQPVIEIPDEDYGVWYVDVSDNTSRYIGKKIRFKGIVAKSDKFNGFCAPGRFAMVCCAEDVQFLGLPCFGGVMDKIKNKQWVDLTATVEERALDVYNGEVGPILVAEKAEKCEKPKEEIVSF